jgi:DNA-binding NarL/FixJ family response regulator
VPHAIRAMVADDNVELAAATTKVLRTQYRVTIPVTNLAGLEPTLVRFAPHVLLLDLMWGEVCVLARLPAIVVAFPKIRILIFSGHPVPRFATDAAKAGATGFLEKPATATEILAATLETATGGQYFSDGLALISNVVRDHSDGPLAVLGLEAHTIGSLAYTIAIAWLVYTLRLTGRQAEVALAIRDGLLEKQTAARLGCKLSTVRKHVRDIYGHLKVVGIVNHGGVAALVERSLLQRPADWRPSQA